MVRRALRRAAAAAALPLIVLLAGCENPVKVGGEHRDAVGARIYDHATGALLVETSGASAPWTGALELAAGQPLDVQVRFVDPAGDEFVLTDQGEYTLRFFFETQGVARYDSHGGHGTVVPLAPGTAEARVFVWHGSHADWRTGLLTVTVAP